MKTRQFFLTILFMGLAFIPLKLFAQGRVSPRIRKSFNASWLFARQANGMGELGSFDRENGDAGQIEPRFRDADQPEYDDSTWQHINLPHTWNAHDVMDEKPGYWRGIGWYRKHFTLDRKFQRKGIFLEFEGVNSVSEFWLNGARIGKHQGGYTRFEFDITDQVHFGEQENVLTVKVDNLFHPTVPPTVKTDYSFYGGIYRDVWLRISEPTYISEVFWATPSVNEQAAEITVQSEIMNRISQPGEYTLVQEIFDPQHHLVQNFSLPVHLLAGNRIELRQDNIRVDHPMLWAPETPYVYQIRTSLKQGEKLVDSVENPLGFRWFKFDPQKGFFLNGKRIRIQGTNWHQSYPGMGNALPNSRHFKDMELIREMGVNFWRTSHYPHDPATIEASDRLGLMVWEELPVNKEIGDPDEYTANVLKMAEEMIRGDRNHPAVILWGIAGEINAPLSVSKRVVAAVAKKYRELDPTRPVVMHEPRSEEIEALVDVVALGVGKGTDEKHRKYPNRNFMTGEYAAATMGRGIYGMGPESEDLACEKHEEYLRRLNLRPWMAGGAIWHQFDYEGETYDTVIPHIVAFGMADIWRIPKDVYYFYQSQWTTKPMVHIVGHWTWPSEEGQSKSVKVYSNAEEVELFLNGKSLGVKREEHDPGLLHPPRLWQVRYEPGELKAVARTEGKEISDTRRTAGPAHHIVLETDVQQLESGNPESLAYITALVVDEHGTVVPSSYHPITFTLYGPGELLEQTWLGHGTGTTWNAIAGMTRIALRATNRTGHTVIGAYSPGLGMGRIELRVSAPGKPDEVEYKERFEADEP
jgi:beta-galactosidase